MPISRNAVPSASRASSARAAANSVSGSAVGSGRRCVRGPRRETGGFQLQRYTAGGVARAPQPLRQAFRQSPKLGFQGCTVRKVLVEGSLRADRFGRGHRCHHARILAARPRGQRRPVVAQQAPRFPVAEFLKLANARQAQIAQPPRLRRAHAGQQRHRLGRQQARGVLAEDREPPRLVAARRKLGEQAVGCQADADGNPEHRFHLAGEAGEGCRGRCVVQLLGAGQVECRFIDGQRLHQRGERPHQRAHPPGDVRIRRHVRFDDDGVRAQLACLEHRHGAVHAGQAGRCSTQW